MVFFYAKKFVKRQSQNWKVKGIFQFIIKDLGASPRGMNWRILFKNCEARLGELNPLEGLKIGSIILHQFRATLYNIF